MPQGDILGFAPPLCLSKEEAHIVVEKTTDAVKTVLAGLSVDALRRRNLSRPIQAQHINDLALGGALDSSDKCPARGLEMFCYFRRADCRTRAKSSHSILAARFVLRTPPL